MALNNGATRDEIAGIRRGGEVGFFGLKKPGIGVVYSLDLKPKKMTWPAFGLA